VSEQTERLQRLEAELQTQGQTWRWLPVVEAIQALRGVQVTAAVSLSAARGARSRFANPRQLRSSLGRIPSAHPTGEPRRPGGLPKTGNAPARRALREGAGASRDPAQVSRPWPRRWEQRPQGLPELSGKAQGRLCQRYRRVVARGQPVTQVVVALARARAACVGARARTVTGAHSGYPWAGWASAWREQPLTSSEQQQSRRPGGA
jgi:transposase